MNDQKNFIAYANLLILVMLAAGIAWQGFRLKDIERQTATLPAPTPAPKRPVAATTKPPKNDERPGSENRQDSTPPRENRDDTKKPESNKPGDKYAAILSKGLFTKQKPPPNPVCMAILGDEALINDNWRKEGEDVNGWKIIQITNERATLEKDGNKLELRLFDAPTLPKPQEDKPIPGLSEVKPDRSNNNKPSKEEKITERQDRRAFTNRRRPNE